MAHPEEYPESPVDLRNEVQHPMVLLLNIPKKTGFTRGWHHICGTIQ